MSEPMTSEMILDAYWQLKGFWTKPRFPFRTPSGGWSDIDLLAYAPEEKHLVISESKVRGGKDQVYVYAPAPEGPDILQWDQDNYFAFLRHVGGICAKGVVFNDFTGQVKKLTIQLVSNYYLSDDILPKTEEFVRSSVKPQVPPGVDLDVKLQTTFDIICQIIVLERKKAQGRRHGHPVIDIARELNRYMHPSLAYGGNRSERETIRNSFREKLATALNNEDP
jgi:hypothetical protein